MLALALKNQQKVEVAFSALLKAAAAGGKIQ